MKFSEFNFHPDLEDGIVASQYEEATPVQEQVIPIILEGKDVIASAQTGTGKTAAFLLPLIDNILSEPELDGFITSLIIVPTRELAIQIAQHVEGLSYFTNVSSIAVYGGGDGKAFIQEKTALSRGADIVICTPGKMMAHIRMGYVKLEQLKYLVLDEADRMLDMGFYDDIMYIINQLKRKRQTLLFSATMPPRIRTLAKQILHQPIEINIAISKPPEKILQQAFLVYDAQKIPLILHLLQQSTTQSVLIFCSSKQSVKELTRTLKRNNFNIAEIHSDLNQDAREQTIINFRTRKVPILVATDILSRGIDIDNIELVVNFDVPHDGEDYVHRIGRTARADTDGMAWTLVSVKEQRKFRAIENLIGKEVVKMSIPTELGEQPAYEAPPQRKNKNYNKKKKFQHKGRRKE